MAKHHLLLFPLLLVAATAVIASPAAAATSLSSTPTPTVYDMLEQYGFPRGLLPEGVQDYAIHPDGSFNVSLPDGCEIYVAGYVLQYGTQVSGNVRSMLIDKLEGVSVKVAIKWIGIKDVRREGDQLKFEAGLLSNSFAVANFAQSPSCNKLIEAPTSSRSK